MIVGMGSVAVTRRKLYEQMWSIPCSLLAARYGISGVGLAKVCKRHDIPRPPRGYWARIAAGQRVRKPLLPKPQLGDEVIVLRGWDMPDDAVQKLVEDPRPVPDLAEMRDGGTLHPLAVVTRDRLLAATTDPEGLLSVSSPAMPVKVSPALIDRSVAIVDALIKRWESRGGTVLVQEPSDVNASSTRFARGRDGLGVEISENVQ